MSSQPPKKITLKYFKIEGSAECVRLALALAGVEYTDEHIDFSDWKSFKDKTPYGQVPVMIFDDNETQMRGQSGAMMRYIANTYTAKNSLYPTECIFDIEEVMGVLEDMKQSFAPALYMGMRPQRFGHPEGYSKTEDGQALVKSMRETWVKEELPKYLGYLEAWLDKNDGKWLATKEAPSLADCVAIPALRTFTKGHVDHVPTTCLDAHPKIVDYVKRFCALEPIKGRYTEGLF